MFIVENQENTEMYKKETLKTLLKWAIPNVLTKEKHNTRFRNQKFSDIMLYHQNHKIYQTSNRTYVQEFSEI